MNQNFVFSTTDMDMIMENAKFASVKQKIRETWEAKTNQSSLTEAFKNKAQVKNNKKSTYSTNDFTLK